MGDPIFDFKGWLSSIFKGWDQQPKIVNGPPENPTSLPVIIKLSPHQVSLLKDLPEPSSSTLMKAATGNREGIYGDNNEKEFDPEVILHDSLLQEQNELHFSSGPLVLDEVFKAAQNIRYIPISFAVRNALQQRLSLDVIVPIRMEEDLALTEPQYYSSQPDLSAIHRVTSLQEFESMLEIAKQERIIYCSCVVSTRNLVGCVTSMMLYFPNKHTGYVVDTVRLATTMIRKSLEMTFPFSTVYIWTLDELQSLCRMFNVTFNNVIIIEYAALHLQIVRLAKKTLCVENASEILVFDESICVRNIQDFLASKLPKQEDVLLLANYRICSSLIEVINSMQYSVLKKETSGAVFEISLRESKKHNIEPFHPVESSNAGDDYDDGRNLFPVSVNRNSFTRFKRAHAHRLSRAILSDVKPEELLTNADLLQISTCNIPSQVNKLQVSTGKNYLKKATWKAANKSSYRYNKCNECFQVGCVALTCPRRNNFDNITKSALSSPELARICREEYNRIDGQEIDNLSYQQWRQRYEAQFLNQSRIGDCSGSLHYPLRFALYGPRPWDIAEFNKFKRTVITPVYQTTFLPKHFRTANIKIRKFLKEYPNYQVRFVQYVESCYSLHGEMAFRFSRKRRTIRILTGVVSIEEVPDYKMEVIKQFKENMHNCKHPF